MDRSKILADLEQLRSALHAEFEDSVGTHSSRLEQLDDALATASMSVNGLFDEEEREVDLAVRIMSGETPNSYEGPIAGRTRKDHYAVVARRAK